MEDFWTEFWKGFWDINIKDVVYIVATIVTVCFAITGYNKWKKELRWKTYFDFAHRFLNSAYRLRDAIIQQRERRFYLPIQLQNTSDKSEESRYAIVEYHKKFYNDSLSKINEAAFPYQSLITEGEILFDKDFRNLAHQMLELVNEYKIAVDCHMEQKYDSVGLLDYPSSDRLLFQKAHETLHIKKHNEKDTFSNNLNLTIDRLDQRLIKHIK